MPNSNDQNFGVQDNPGADKSAASPPDGQPETPVTDISEDRLFAALSYLFVLVLVPLLVRRQNPYVQWHARQGLVIFVGLIIAMIAVRWVAIVGNLLWIILLIAEVVGLLNALLGRRWKIPVIGDIAARFRV